VTAPPDVDQPVERVHLRALLAVAARAKDDVAAEVVRGRLAELEAELAHAPPSPRMARLIERLGLEPVERDFLWTVLAFTTDLRVAAHAEALGGPLSRRGVNAVLHSELHDLAPELGRRLVLRLAGEGPLVGFGILAPGDDAAPPAIRPYQIPSRVLAYLAGHDAPERGVDAIVAAEGWLHDDRQAATLAELARVMREDTAPLVIVEGPRGAGRRSAIASATGRRVLAIDLDRVEPAALLRQLVALRRETCLGDGVPVVANADRFGSDEARNLLARFVEEVPGPIAVTAASGGLDLPVTRPVFRLRWNVPEAALRRRLWVQLAGDTGEPGGELDGLALRYRVGPAAIARAVESARTLRGDGVLDAAALAIGLRHNIAERMAGLARRVEVTQRWDDVVLADDTLDQVHALIARVQHGHQVLEQWGYRGKMARGTGVAALFSGPPGTGKTMVAGLIAHELDLDLYQVDLSQVVSKWVGETEKQLAQVFDAAEEGHALLLFDEADALFGQRSAEVRSAVDRYANLEVNFLLQRIESFGGITILTTNLDASIDRALKRRLAGHIVFGQPDEDERARLWERLTSTASAPVGGDIDYDDLARDFPTMSGANIRNAAISAAFLAAAEGAGTIGQDHLIRAARAEYRSMGHILAERSSLGRSTRRST
jgi:hypothetical protein